MSSPTGFTWVFPAQAHEDGSVSIFACASGLTVEICVWRDHSFGFKPVKSSEGLSRDIFNRVAAWLGERNAIRYRLLDWSVRKVGLKVPVARVLDLRLAKAGLEFRVQIEQAEVEVLVRGDLSPVWPGEVNLATNEAVAWNAYNTCLGHMLEHQNELEEMGFDASTLDMDDEGLLATCR